MAVRLIPILPDDIGDVWGFIAQWLESACQADESASDIMDDCLSGKRNLFVVMDGLEILAAVVVEICNYPKRKVMCGHYCVGKHRRRWQHLYEELELWAKKQGCTKVKLIARPGWERLWKGYTKTHVLLEKDL